MLQEALPLFRRLVAGLSSRWSAFDPSPIHVGLVKDEVTVVQDPPPPKYFWFTLSVSLHQCSTPIFILIFKQNCGRFDVWGSHKAAAEDSLLLGFGHCVAGRVIPDVSKVQAVFSDLPLQVRSQPAHGWWQHSLPVFTQMHLFAPAVRLSSPCAQVNAGVLPKNIWRNATTATSLRIRCVFEHVRSKTNCVRLPHEGLVRKPQPNPWPWPYLGLSVTVPSAERERTLNGVWSTLS